MSDDPGKFSDGAAKKTVRPADPIARREPLPWERPKPSIDDPEADARLAAILESPSYVPATEDAKFLSSDQLRGARLQIEYLKPELTLNRLGIEETIVVFGSTRIPEPAAALRRLEQVRKDFAKTAYPDSNLKRRLTAAERIVEKSRYYEVARAFGRIVAGANWNGDKRAVIMTGGGPGIMEAANRGAFDGDGQSIGLNISLPREQYPNPYVTPELCFRLHYFSIRKLHLVKRARALVAFPGGYGTLDELFETLTLIQTRKIKPIPVVLVGRSFWRGAVDFDFLVDEGVIDPEDAELFWFAETAEEIWDGILRWHEVAAKPLVSR
jgi:uncharacterized protein (TIGR00730 family)